MNEANDNPFDEKHVAEEWIAAVESEFGGARENEVYPRLNNWISNNKWKSVLEIGSGQGVCSGHIQVDEYIGIEPSSFLVDRANQLYKAVNRKFIKGSAYNLDFEESIFDAAFSVGVWFHLENLNNVHSELKKVLREGGGLLIVTSNPDVHDVWESIVVGEKEGKRIEGEALLPTGKLSRNIFYLHSEKEIVSSLEKNSFEVIDIQKFGSGSKNVEKGTEKVWMSVEAIKKG